MSHKTKACANPVYHCFRSECDHCYCTHDYDEKRFTWRCPDGTVASLGWHASAHHRLGQRPT